MASVFFSYSHADEELRDVLEKHLAMLKHQGLVETWHDRRIKAGDEFENEISTELEEADVILLLVSPDFMASRYCYEVEMQRAMERHAAGSARVIPVILRHCDWHPAPFGGLLAAPKDGKPVRAWADMDEALLDVIQKIRAALPCGSTAATMAGARMRSNSLTVPRSSNLRLKKDYTEADRDRFLHDGFEFMARFFENSLGELQERNQGIETAFRRIDANRFSAVIYRSGKTIARCKIVLGGMFGRGITYSNNDQASDNSCNESLSVEASDQDLHMKAMGMASMRHSDHKHLTAEGAAEYYWSLLIEPLQH